MNNARERSTVGEDEDALWTGEEHTNTRHRATEPYGIMTQYSTGTAGRFTHVVYGLRGVNGKGFNGFHQVHGRRRLGNGAVNFGWYK